MYLACALFQMHQTDNRFPQLIALLTGDYSRVSPPKSQHVNMDIGNYRFHQQIFVICPR